MNKQTIVSILVERGYNRANAAAVCEDLLRLEAPLVKIFRQWLDTGAEQDFLFRDYSIRYFMANWGMKFPAALLTMDWILKEPEKAIEELKNKIR